MSSKNEQLMELANSNKLLAISMDNVAKAVEKINDQNVLHIARTEEDHRTLMGKVRLMTDKYWYLIWGLLLVIFAAFGIAPKFGLL